MRFSIVLKLNAKLFFRTLNYFLMLDLIFCLGCTAGLIAHAEQTSATIAGVLSETGLPLQNEKNWLTYAFGSQEIIPEQET